MAGMDGLSVANKLAQPFRSDAATTVQSRIAPLVIAKFNELAQNYEDELGEKDAAERDAQRILANTQAELAAARAGIAELESRADPDEVAAKVSQEVDKLRQQAASFVTHQSRICIRAQVDDELANSANGDDAQGDDTPEDRLQLAAELQNLLHEQRQAEMEYIDARAAVGTGERIDKYRRLLRSCLGPDDQDMLDANLDDLIKMMEEDVDSAGGQAGPGPEGMEIVGM
jgi:chromosome segregation ATPase